MSVVDRILKGSIDMHVHYGPDPKVERRVDALEGARQAKEAGMRAIVVKCHDYPSAPVALVVSQVVPDIAVIGSLTLNRQAGGLSPQVVETSARLGAKVVWMPTVDSANDMKLRGITGEGITILDAKGKLLPVVGEILDIIKGYGMVLATGHLSKQESFALVDEARKKGLPRILITHPLSEAVGAHLSLDEQRQMVEKGAFIEHCFVSIVTSRRDPMLIVEAVRAIGAEHCIMSTDFGQAFNPAPAEGMRMMIAYMLKSGLTEREMEIMVKENPARLLGLD